MIKEIGFTGFFSGECYANDFEKMSAFKNNAEKIGLIQETSHSTIPGSWSIWNDNAEGENYVDVLKLNIDNCSKLSVPILVVHIQPDFARMPSFEIGLNRLKPIVKYAKEHNIKIAFENTEGEEYLFALMEHFKDNDTVGYCWDSGHEMCYNHSQDLLAKFGDRLIMTHINDNLGISRFDGKTFWTDDLHLLPFDGIADWDYNVERLKKSKHLDILNFELNIKSKPDRHENDCYGQMTLKQYFAEAYKRACKIAYRYSK